jgi:hypothetical protein
MLHGLLENNVKGGLKNYFDGFYTKEYIQSLHKNVTKTNKMLRFHSILDEFLLEA